QHTTYLKACDPLVYSGNYEDYYNDSFEDFGVCKYERHSALFLPVLYSLCFVIGLIGNGLVFWVILARVKLRNMTDVCLLNLAIADLLLLCALPFLAHYSRADWVFGEAMCKIILGTYYIGFYSGIFFVTLMSIDRYLAIVHAVYALKARTRTYGLIASAVVWILGVLASFPELHFIAVQSQFNSILCLVHYNTEDNFLRVFGLLKMNALGLLIPLIIIVFCNSVIISRQLYSKLMKRKTIHLVLSVVVVFFCCWVPYNVASFFKALEFIEVYTACHSSKAIRLSLQITEALAYSHTCWNPVLYVFVEKRFRKHLLQLTNNTLSIKHPFFNTISPVLHSQTSKTDHLN
uniref:G-protein coupled receptors family 1 profile domain-containing protein n=1 Tax=Scleropages formosus TaxID=113540 RepID=A0A8C9UXY2_SCLFO